MAEKAEDARRELRQLLIGAEVYPLVGAVTVPDWMARSAARNMDDGGQDGGGEVVRARAKLKEVGRNAAVAILRERGYVEARRELDLLEEEFKREESEYADYYENEIRYRRNVANEVERWVESKRGEYAQNGPLRFGEGDLSFDYSAPWSWRTTRSDGDVWARLVVKPHVLKGWGVGEAGEAFRVNPPISEIQLRNRLHLYVSEIEQEARPYRQILDALLFRFQNLRRVVAEYEMFGYVPEWGELLPEERSKSVESPDWVRRKKAVVNKLVVEIDGEVIKRSRWLNADSVALFKEMDAEEEVADGTVRRQFQRNLEDKYPGGGGIEPWIAWAREEKERELRR